jgi:imidazolonepropionase-like amidohydrolase
VIGIRDMHGELEVAKQVKRDIQAGKYPGPHIYYSGSLIDGPKPVSPTFPSAKTVDDARRIARERMEKGVDFVKVYSRLTRDQFFAIADEVKKLGVPFAGHVPFSVTAAEASKAGLHAFEHLLSVETGVSTKEDELRQIQMDAEVFQWPDADTINQTYSKEKANELYACFVKNDTWQVPTLVVIEAMMNKSESVAKGDSRFKFLPAFMKEFWSFEYPRFGDKFERNMKALYPFYEMLVRDMHSAGVGILAGTDTPNPFVFPGFSLHKELELLVQAGLTPMEALRSATINPARFLGYLDSHGTIEKGKAADLVLLNANPLDNIGNTKEIEAVILGGKLLGQTEIRSLWKKAEDAAARDKTTLQDLFKPPKDK